MSTPRVLMICHGHPDLVPGGTEVVAHDLWSALRDGDHARTVFLGCVTRLHRQPRTESRLQAVTRSNGGMSNGGRERRPADELLLWVGGYDPFMMVQTEAADFARALEQLLVEFTPDVVHFHHLSLIGLDALVIVKRLLPRARIVLTLHDYMTICTNDGLMVRRPSGAPCRKSSPDACHRCFPETQQSRFFARDLHMRNILALVDQFIAPSRFLRDRFIDWGLAPDRVAVIPNAVPSRSMPTGCSTDPDIHRTFAYFGNIAPHKGVMVALDAARAVTDQPISLQVHGDLNFQAESFRSSFVAAVDGQAGKVIWRGSYRRDELPALMAGTGWVVVPSTWWENAPLVILEAFRHGRPVICSDIGGMAEMVEDDVSGLRFRAGDAQDLARVMRRAAGDRKLWQRLSTNLPRVPDVAETAATHAALYEVLMHSRLDAA